MTRTPRRVERGEWLVVILWSIVLLGVLYLWGTQRTGVFKDDTQYYGLLSRDLADPARMPYTFRLLTPWLVGLMQIDTAAGFTVVTLAALLGSAILLYLFMSRLGYQRAASLGALTVFLCSSAVIRALTTPTYVDSLTYLLTMASLIALMARRDALFCLLVAIGALNRETALLLLPSLIVARWPILGAARWGRVIVLSAIPVLVLIAEVVGKLAVMGLFVQGSAVLQKLGYSGYVQRIPQLGDVLDFYSLFGVAWLALLLGWRVAPRWLLAYGVMVVAQLVIARGDESRVLSHMFPLVIPLVALLLERAQARSTVVMVALVASMVMSMIHFRWTVVTPESVRYSSVAIGTIVGVAITLWVWWTEKRAYREPAEGTADAGARSGV